MTGGEEVDAVDWTSKTVSFLSLELHSRKISIQYNRMLEMILLFFFFKVYFGSQFEKFQSISLYLRDCVKAAHHGGSIS